jgi:hypothetical protein
MSGRTISPTQFEATIAMLREGYEAGALKDIQIEYPGVAADAYPRMQAHLVYSSRPSQGAMEWLTGTFAKLRQIFAL